MGDAHGKKGALARWHAEVHGNILKLKNRSSGKFLRMRADGGIDAKGVGKEWCEWRIVNKGKGVAKLQSKAHGKYLAFRNGRVIAGKGGPFCGRTAVIANDRAFVPRFCRHFVCFCFVSPLSAG